MAFAQRAASMTLLQRLVARSSTCHTVHRGVAVGTIVTTCRKLGGESRSVGPGLLPLGAGACRSFSSSSRPDDPYKILGVDRKATQEEIKKAYKKEAMKWHPDRQPPEKREEAQKRFTQVANAYQTLSNPETRRVQDAGGGGANGFHGPGFHPAGAGGNTQANPEDLFRQVFGSQGLNEMFVGMHAAMHGIPGVGAPGMVAVGATVKVRADKHRMILLCRQAGIDSTNDSKRLQAIGKEGRIIKVDQDDNTAKVAVTGVGDVWFPAETLDVKGGASIDHPFMAFGSPFVNTPFAGGGGAAQEQQVQQRVVTKPDGRQVIQVTVRTRMPDGRMQEVVSEVDAR